MFYKDSGMLVTEDYGTYIHSRSANLRNNRIDSNLDIERKKRKE